MIHMCHSINTEGYTLLREGKQETNEGSKKIFLNVKGAYIWSESQITDNHTFLVGVQSPLYTAWNWRRKKMDTIIVMVLEMKIRIIQA